MNAYADAAVALGSEVMSHSRVENGRYTLGSSMSAMALPVISRMAAIMSSLTNEKPVSSVAAIAPRKARLNKDTFKTTVRPTSLALYGDESGFDMIGEGDIFPDSEILPEAGTRLQPTTVFDNANP